MINRSDSRGFTLFEILIAIFIFSLVVSIVFGSFREISKGSGIINTSNDDYEMVQGFMELIGRDLESAYVEQKPAYKKPGTGGTPDPFRVVGKTEYIGSASFPMLRFTSLSHLPVNRDSRNGISEIVYYADKSDEYGVILKRSDRLFFYDEFVKKTIHPVALRRIKSMAFKYIDADGQEHDAWDSESGEFHYATPSAVGIRIEIEDEGRTMVFENRIQLRCVREKSD